MKTFIAMLSSIGTHADGRVYWGGIGFVQSDISRFMSYCVIQAEDEDEAVSKLVKERYKRDDFEAEFYEVEFDAWNLLTYHKNKDIIYPDFGLKVKEVRDDVTNCHKFDDCPLRTYRFKR